MSYEISLEFISTDELFTYLKNRDLLQSHMILKEGLEEKRDKIIKSGFKDVATLYKLIKTQKKCESFSDEVGIEFEYINVLRRHISSLIAKARKLEEFSYISHIELQLLHEKKIVTTKDLYEKFYSISTSNPYYEYLKGIKELTRLRYVAAKFADLIFFSGYTTIESISIEEPSILKDKINETNRKRKIANISLGLSDAKFLVDDAILYNNWLNKGE